MAAVIEPGSELEQVVVISEALDAAIARLDAEPTMAPVSQLAVVGVAVLRAVAPLVRGEKDRMLAAAAKVAGSKS